jgi:hypothetical protein
VALIPPEVRANPSRTMRTAPAVSTAGPENGKLNGGRGEDEISGGDGDDSVRSRGDGKEADSVTCGEGEDSVRADRNDVVRGGLRRDQTAGA